MKIISYNVNGIRAALTKGFTEWLKSANPDVLCLQEIKALEAQIPTEVFTELGYTYQYYHSAEKKGYSGVAILSKIKPKHVKVGTGIDYMDREGRVLRALSAIRYQSRPFRLQANLYGRLSEIYRQVETNNT